SDGAGSHGRPTDASTVCPQRPRGRMPGAPGHLLPWPADEERKPLTEPGSTDAAAPARPAFARRRVVSTGNLLVLIATLAAALWGLWWLYDRLTNVYVLDARIASDMLLLSSQVSGWIVEVPVEESERVRKGDVLV